MGYDVARGDIAVKIVGGREDGSNTFNILHVDEQGRPRMRGEVWDSDSLSWVAMTQPSGGGVTSSTKKFNSMADDGTYQYFGFSDGGGAWTIKRLTVATNDMRYASGASDYATAWTNRESLTYGY